MASETLVDTIRRRRAVAVAAALAILAVLAFAVRSCGGDGAGPPAAGAERLVPADALLYVHLSTDGDRDAVKRALELAGRFPSFPRARSAALSRLSSAGPGLSFERDVRPWLGDDAALALLNSRGATAGSLVILDVADRGKAESFLRRVAGDPRTADYRGTPISSYGNAVAAFVRGRLVVGQDAGVRAAIDASAGRAPSLGRSNVYDRAIDGLPDERVADVYASPDGVSRLLAAQGGAIGAAGALLDQPGLQGVGIALVPRESGAQLRVHSVLDPRAGRAGRSKPFAPELIGSVPEDAMAYLGLTRLDRAGQRLLAAGLAGGGAGRRLTEILERVQRDLDRRAGVNLRRDVLPLLQGEVALWLAPAIPAPILTLISKTEDERRTREAFAGLQEPLARLLAQPGAGAVPAFRERDVDGVQAFQLTLGPGIELDYAVFDGKLVVSTSLGGIRAVKEADGSLADNESFDATLGDRPDEVTSLVFLDFAQLLRLGERTGLSDSRAYLAVREDLRRIKAAGASATGDETETTTELTIQIP